MKFSKKIRIFAIFTAVIMMLGTVGAFAAQLDQNMHGKDMTFGERAEYALQGTVTGMLMVFAVLGLLYGIVTLSRVFLYDLPNRKKEIKPKKKKGNKVVVVEDEEEISALCDPTVIVPEHDEGELAAVITAAIAAMLESEEYKNEFVGGFRVVSFKRSTDGAWNKK